jgi:hypothetical protein
MFFFLQTTLRKREVQLSRISVYIVVIIVTCHTIRIIPNTWEIAQTFNGEHEEVRILIMSQESKTLIPTILNETMEREREKSFKPCFAPLVDLTTVL